MTTPPADGRDAQVETWRTELRDALQQAQAGAQLATMRASVAVAHALPADRTPDRSTVRGRAEVEARRAGRRRLRQLDPRRKVRRWRADRRRRVESREWRWDRGHTKQTPGMQVRAVAHRVSTLAHDPAAALGALGPAHRTGRERLCAICTTVTDLDRCPLCGPQAPLVDHIACSGCGTPDEVDRVRLDQPHTGRKCRGKWEPCAGDCRRCQGGTQ